MTNSVASRSSVDRESTRCAESLRLICHHFSTRQIANIVKGGDDPMLTFDVAGAPRFERQIAFERDGDKLLDLCT